MFVNLRLTLSVCTTTGPPALCRSTKKGSGMRARWAHAALTTLIWLTLPMWAAAAGFLLWLLDDGPTECGAAMAYALVLALAGTVCYSIRRNRAGAAADLLEALLATRPCDAPRLAAVPEQRSAS